MDSTATSHLVAQLVQLRLNREDADVTITCGGKIIKAHSFILGMRYWRNAPFKHVHAGELTTLRSVYFKTAMTTAVGENRKVLDVQECPPHVLATIFDFMYGIDIPEDISYDDAERVLGMADLYLMDDLKDAVAPHIGKKLSAGNIFQKPSIQIAGSKNIQHYECR